MAEQTRSAQPREEPATGCASRLPLLTLAIGILVWDLIVRLNNIPPYQLPGPILVFTTLIQDWQILWSSRCW